MIISPNKHRIYFFLLTGLFSIFFALSPLENAFAASSSKSALDNYEKGLTAMEKNKIEEAISFFEKAIRLEKKDMKLRIGMVYYEYSPNKKLEECKQRLSQRGQQPVQVKEQEKEKREETISEQPGTEIVITEPPTQGQKVSYGQRSIAIKGNVRTKAKISWLKINQREVPCETNGNFQSDIPLAVGMNTITIQTEDEGGKRAEAFLTIERGKPEIQASQLYQKSIAVIIGIDDYVNCAGVKYAANSAQNVQEKLKKIGFHDITTLLDREASKERIYYELRHKLPLKAGPNDRVVIYFAGHSYEDGLSNDLKHKFIISANAETVQSSDSEISLAFIKDISDHIAAKHILCVFDACFSGLEHHMQSAQAVNASSDIESMTNRKALEFITLNCEEKVSGTENQGLLTNNFLKGLDGMADADRDGFIIGTELGMYIQGASKNPQGTFFGRIQGDGEIFF